MLIYSIKKQTPSIESPICKIQRTKKIPFLLQQKCVLNHCDNSLSKDMKGIRMIFGMQKWNAPKRANLYVFCFDFDKSSFVAGGFFEDASQCY